MLRVPFSPHRVGKKCYFAFFCALLILTAFSFFKNPDILRRKPENGSSTHHDFWSTSNDSLQDGAVARRDWHDRDAMRRDALRSGPGEGGVAADLKNESNVSQERSIRETGFNALLSDAISVQRSLPEVRHEGCRNRPYFAHLPRTSIVLVFHNEQLSVLLRTLHSLISRTPAELLQEIILVDDLSDTPSLAAELDAYLAAHFADEPLRVLRLPERVGLIRARLAGAREAHGDVLVFVDSHVEATHNWLPPLLQPIALDWRTATTPLIDTIDYTSFAYVPQQSHGMRGHFNWQFNYVQLPLLPQEEKRLPDAHANPVMNGGLFAIAAKFFWRLGGYDDQLLVWGAEQFEMSFKIWMCGGQLLEVPCSRFGHLYRADDFYMQHSRSEDFMARNYKRVAEVWMDEFKQFLYERSPKLMHIEAGDLSERVTLRHRLRCKSFGWYLKQVAFDLLPVYPQVEPSDFASGAIQSLDSPSLCLEVPSSKSSVTDRLSRCAPDLAFPYTSQSWQLSFRHELRTDDGCLEVRGWEQDAAPHLWPCHLQGGNQYWFYDRLTQMLVNGKAQSAQRCLDADRQQGRVRVKACVFGKASMRWRFGYVNQTAMDGERRADV